MQRLLSLHQPSSCVVFCNTKKDCQAVCDALNEVGQSALSLHGDLEQRDRDQTLVRFANGSARVLVATDVAARGLDIKSLELVVNFELAWDPEVHVHRIGRTARAGNSGLAISFCAPEEAQRANIISDMLQIKLNWQTPPVNSSIVPLEAEMATLCIDGGKKAKMRPGAQILAKSPCIRRMFMSRCVRLLLIKHGNSYRAGRLKEKRAGCGY